MKSFENICKMTQQQVKAYMKKYLGSKKYNVIDQDGFLYAKGTVPVLLVAHMDTVHREQCKSIVHIDNKISSPQGIGGDDRCGVFIIMNIIKDLHCSVLLCEDEEKGCIGASKFISAYEDYTGEDGKPAKRKYIENLGVNYMVEFDRRGNSDAVFYHCDNKEFTTFVEDATNFKLAYGSTSDISVLMPAAKLAAVNLSCGYYKAHTTEEYVMYDEMLDTIEAAKTLIKEECDKPFEYIRRQYAYYGGGANYSSNASSWGGRNRNYTQWGCDDEYYGNLLDGPDTTHSDPLSVVALNDTGLELEVIIYSQDGEKALQATGDTKAECWMTLFLENPNLCFNDIVDYSWG